jgi:hypothetical protein
LSLTPENALRLHLSKAREYWQEDRLDLADAAIRSALRVGIPSGDWYNLQRTIEAENGARLAGIRQQIGPNLIVEASQSDWGERWPLMCRAVADAFAHVTGTLEVAWSMPVLLTLIPSDEWVEFMHARYGYYARRTRVHKVCLPPSASHPPHLLIMASRHEMAHAAVHEIGSEEIPRWLDEGIAVLMEGMPAAAHSPPRMRLNEISAGFESFRTDIGGIQSHRCYQQAHAIVAGLQDRCGIAGIRKVLEAMGEGRSPDRAFRNGVGIRLADLEREWRGS